MNLRRNGSLSYSSINTSQDGLKVVAKTVVEKAHQNLEINFKIVANDQYIALIRSVGSIKSATRLTG